MQVFIGCKIIKAEPMTQDMFQRNIKENDDWADFETIQGYHVIYPQPDGGEYHSWSPATVFEESYRELNDGETAFVKASGKNVRY
jgi:hypothetical protein